MDFGFLAPKRFFMMSAHKRRDARNFATSSNTLLCAFQKKDKRPANVSTSRPALRAASTYAIPSAIVKAISCAAVEPDHEYGNQKWRLYSILERFESNIRRY